MNQPAKVKSAQFQHVNWEDVPVEALNPLLDRQLAVGEHMMIGRLVLRKGCVVPLHSHANEQLTHVQSGALQFTVDGEDITLHPGEWLVIPPNVPHMVLALEDTVDIDVFTPPRQDWINKTDQYLRSR